MKLVSFSTGDGKVRPGALVEDSVVELAGHADTLAAIAAGVTSSDKSGSMHKLADVRLHAPLANPPRVFAIGLNYRDHAAESKMTLPNFPVVFFKLQTAIVGPGDAIVLPKNCSEPDYMKRSSHLSSAKLRISHPRFKVARACLRLHNYQ